MSSEGETHTAFNVIVSKIEMLFVVCTENDWSGFNRPLLHLIFTYRLWTNIGQISRNKSCDMVVDSRKENFE